MWGGGIKTICKNRLNYRKMRELKLFLLTLDVFQFSEKLFEFYAKEEFRSRIFQSKTITTIYYVE